MAIRCGKSQSLEPNVDKALSNDRRNPHSPSAKCKLPESFFLEIRRSHNLKHTLDIPTIRLLSTRNSTTNNRKRKLVSRHNRRDLNTFPCPWFAIGVDDGNHEARPLGIFHGCRLEARPASPHREPDDGFGKIPRVADPDSGNVTTRAKTRIGFFHADPVACFVGCQEAKVLEGSCRRDGRRGDGSHGYLRVRNHRTDCEKRRQG